MTKRRSYSLNLNINGRKIDTVIVDPHYENKHPDINDEIILKLVRTLDGNDYDIEERKDDWEFYMLDRIPLEDKFYRLVWCLKDGALFIGIINCFRR